MKTNFNFLIRKLTMSLCTLLSPLIFSAKDPQTAGKKLGCIIANLTGQEEFDFEIEFDRINYRVFYRTIYQKTEPPTTISNVDVKMIL